MIKLCENSDYFLDICDKLKEIKGIKLTQKILYNYMIAGLYSKQVFTFISYDKEIINGCLVLLHTKDLMGENALTMIFTWIDAHYPKLHKEFIDIAEKKARELQVRKISFITNRKEKVINRKVGKYGFKKTCSIFEKEVI